MSDSTVKINKISRCQGRASAKGHAPLIGYLFLFCAICCLLILMCLFLMKKFNCEPIQGLNIVILAISSFLVNFVFRKNYARAFTDKEFFRLFLWSWLCDSCFQSVPGIRLLIHGLLDESKLVGLMLVLGLHAASIAYGYSSFPFRRNLVT